MTEQFGPLEALARYAALNHNSVLGQVDKNGHFNYYRYPHHHMPSPFLPQALDAIDVREIRSYVYVYESVCLGIEDGHLQRRILARNEIPLGELAP